MTIPGSDDSNPSSSEHLSTIDSAVSAINSTPSQSSIDTNFQENTSLTSTLHQVITHSYLLASVLTTPICKCHELYRKIQLIPFQHQDAYRVTNVVRQTFLMFQLSLFGAVATITTLPGALLRTLASRLNNNSYIYMQGSAPEKKEHNGSFTALSWNVCCTAGGYSISDGGVPPWKERIDRIIDEIIRQDADVISLYEIFDTNAGFYLQKKLQEIYPHFYFAMGQRGIGASSGIFVASKFKVANESFTKFPEEMLVGRTKNCSKGIFSFDVVGETRLFARIHATHLQHSEEVSFPTDEEVSARRAQMDLLLQKANEISDRATLVIGDLNLDEEEYNESILRENFLRDTSIENIPTWGGDAFCANLVGQRVSSPKVLDYSLLKNGSARQISTELVETGYLASEYRQSATSDHLGMKNTITL